MHTIKLWIQYEGTRYKGWQRQKLTDNTIQGKLERILSRQFGREIEIHGSGRTDAGVHARMQIADVRLTDEELASLHGDLVALRDLLNTYLPEDIGVVEVLSASERFHSRLNAAEKTYVYRIWNSPVPNVLERRYLWQVETPLDLTAMERAAAFLCGQHDFAAFCGNPKMKKSTVRSVYQIRISRQGQEIRVKITGNGFLQNMVRIITGTLVEVGLGMRPPEDMKRILETKDRQSAGQKAPALGLILWEVKYN